MALSVRTIEADRHREFNAAQPSVSFLQTPAWGQVKSEWGSESVGWFNGNDGPVGAGLVLYRQLPKIKKYLAYLPEGPVIDWSGDDLEAWLTPLVAHLRKQGAFAVRMGPPVVTRRWSADQVKAGIADASVRSLGDVPPLERSQEGACVIVADLLADTHGALLIADNYRPRVWRVDPASGRFSLVAGNGSGGFCGDGGDARAACVRPTRLARDAQGNLFVLDDAEDRGFGTRVRRIDAETGVITTVAGDRIRGRIASASDERIGLDDGNDVRIADIKSAFIEPELKKENR